MFIFSIGQMNFKTFPSNLVMKTEFIIEIFFKSVKKLGFSTTNIGLPDQLYHFKIHHSIYKN